MMLGRITGSVTTKDFSFKAEAKVKKLQYVAVKDYEGRWILSYIDSITNYANSTVAKAKVIGYRDSRNFLKPLPIPFEPGTPVYLADDELIKQTLGLKDEGLYIGILEGYNIQVNLPVKHLLTKHVAVLAKTGAGKSYAVGVLLEEMMEKNIPCVVIDPHGEYCTLVEENKRENEISQMKRFGIKPKGYRDKVQIFDVGGQNPIKLDARLSPEEILEMLPTKVSHGEEGFLYGAFKKFADKNYTLKDLIKELGKDESSFKRNLVNLLEYLDATKLFSANPTNPEEIVKEGKLSIIDLKDATPEVQQILVFKLAKELFNARKYGKIPEFFFVIEEAHNFCPERSLGEVASSKIIRTIASEGRKFGVGLCIISQRPAKVDKNVLSQCSTQIILKVTNPNDIRAIMDSVEGIELGTREEIKDLPVGVAMVVGVTEQPLIVDIRVRRSQHGGETVVKITETKEETEMPITYESKISLIAPRYFEEDVLRIFKSVDDIHFLNYPLWKVSAVHQGKDVEFYVDGITGEIFFSEGDKIVSSKGLDIILNLAPNERKILLYLLKEKGAKIEKIAKDMNMALSDVKEMLKMLIEKGFLISEGENYLPSKNFKIPQSIEEMSIERKLLEKDREGETLDFVISSDVAKKIANIFDMHSLEIKPVYYPYWLITYKKKKYLVDALSNRLEIEKSKALKNII